MNSLNCYIIICANKYYFTLTEMYEAPTEVENNSFFINNFLWYMKWTHYTYDLPVYSLSFSNGNILSCALYPCNWA